MPFFLDVYGSGGRQSLRQSLRQSVFEPHFRPPSAFRWTITGDDDGLRFRVRSRDRGRGQGGCRASHLIVFLNAILNGTLTRSAYSTSLYRNGIRQSLRQCLRQSCKILMCCRPEHRVAAAIHRAKYRHAGNRPLRRVCRSVHWHRIPASVLLGGSLLRARSLPMRQYRPCR